VVSHGCYYVIMYCSQCAYRWVLNDVPRPATRYRPAALCRRRQTRSTCDLEETVSSQLSGHALNPSSTAEYISFSAVCFFNVCSELSAATL